jgi:hypothetical protein
VSHVGIGFSWRDVRRCKYAPIRSGILRPAKISLFPDMTAVRVPSGGCTARRKTLQAATVTWMHQW